MIRISKMDCTTSDQYNFVQCPNCSGRLCDKPKKVKVGILKPHGKSMEHVIVKCSKCSSRFVISISEE